MKKKILYSLLSILSIMFGCFYALANFDIFDINDNVLETLGLSGENLSYLHFNFSGNDFYGFMILGETKVETGEINLSGTTLNCEKQLTGIYYNPARGNTIRPLDSDTLNTLSGEFFTGYDKLELSGGFFTECFMSGSSESPLTVTSGSVFGYIKHTISGVSTEYEMRAGIKINNNGEPTHSFDNSLEYIPDPTIAISGYIYDKHGGTARVYAKEPLIILAKIIGSGVTITGGSYTANSTGIQINILSNKNSEYKITGDITDTMTGYLTGELTGTVAITLSGGTGRKDIYASVNTGEEIRTKNFIIYLTDEDSPVVTLEFPISGATITGYSVDFRREGSDNRGISGYTFYITGNSRNFNSTGTTKTGYSMTNLSGGEYTWHVIATDINGNTGMSEIWTFTISGEIARPILTSPDTGLNVEIGELGLSRESLTGANSGYTRQIANNSGFSTGIVISGTTISTGVSGIIHNPNFMTGTFYWRVIDNKGGGISEHRSVIITGTASGVDTKIEPINLGTITGADLSKIYSSNTVLITGLTDNVAVLARLENNTGALFVNNLMVGNQYLVKNGDKLRIEMISRNLYDTTVSTKLIIGTGDSLVSGQFIIHTKTGTNYIPSNLNLPYTLRIQAILLIDSLAEVYKQNPERWYSFLTTFKAIIKDKIDMITSDIRATNNENEISLLEKQKDSLEYLYFVIESNIKNIDYSQQSVYIAPNCKEYIVKFDDSRMAYTSPNFIHPKFFPTRELFTQHIDANNPGNCNNGIYNKEVITTPNNKKYSIQLENGKRTSNDMKYKKYFDSKEQLVEYIMINNPSDTWDHNIDTSFTPVVFVAPNGKSYTIFKTASTGNNANKFSSFMFVSPKYFNSLEGAKNHIINNNKK